MKIYKLIFFGEEKKRRDEVRNLFLVLQLKILPNLDKKNSKCANSTTGIKLKV